MSKLTDDGVGESIVLKAKVHPKTVLTDFLSQWQFQNRGFLVNKKVADVLSEFKLDKAQVIKTEATYKEAVYPYYWIHLLKDEAGEMDFENTSFDLVDKRTWTKVLTHKRMTRMEYLTKSMKMALDKIIWPEESIVNIKDPDVLQYDLLQFRLSPLHLIASEELRTRVLNEKFTGVEFSDEPYITLKSE